MLCGMKTTERQKKREREKEEEEFHLGEKGINDEWKI